VYGAAVARRIAEFMTEKTVRNHVSAILMKLQVPDRSAAAIKAHEASRPSRNEGSWL
jgi:DNA-binding NarL/FixJ family response regulator